jgi:hypothetical protein
MADNTSVRAVGAGEQIDPTYRRLQTSYQQHVTFTSPPFWLGVLSIKADIWRLLTSQLSTIFLFDSHSLGVDEM